MGSSAQQQQPQPPPPSHPSSVLMQQQQHTPNIGLGLSPPVVNQINPGEELAKGVAKCDRISELSNDILIFIISKLTLREATATCILLTRWRRLYAYSSGLDFSPFKPQLKPPYKECLEEIVGKRFPNYINTINHILDSHKGGRVKEFRVHMHCLEGANIERWLEFSLARKVEILDIHMRYLSGARRGQYYLHLSNLISTNSGQLLKCLTKLSLCAVYVDDAEVELLLSNSPLLESLSIELSDGLANVLIVGHHSLLLKHLGISYARNLKSIEIRNMMNLMSLRCYGLASTYVLRLSNVPKLMEFDTSDNLHNTLALVLPTIPSCIINQLRRLKLSTCLNYIGYYSPTYVLPELVNVKHLELEVNLWRTDSNTFKLRPFVEACRSIEELDVKFSWSLDSTKFKDREMIKWYNHLNKKLSPNLKRLKLSGYLGSPSELEFALFILKNVDALQELIVETNSDVSNIIQQQARARARVQFRKRIRKSVKLLII